MVERRIPIENADARGAREDAARLAAVAPDTAPDTAPDPASETHLQLLRLLEANPALSQRELAQELGISVGKINYCVNALLAKGWIKARNFKNSRNKLAYAYLLTPSGFEQKAALTVNFLRRKLDEYERLHREIAQLRAEVGPDAAAADAGGVMPRRRSTDPGATNRRGR